MHTNGRSAMTRRTVLSGLTAAAALPVMAQSIPPNPDVVVIGAGAAGLAAARKLMADGRSVVVVEGANRVGGRAYTESETFGVPYDHGCFNVMGPQNFDLLTMAQTGDYEMRSMASMPETLYMGDRRASSAEVNQYGRTWSEMTSALNAAGRKGVDIPWTEAMPDDFLNRPFAALSQTWMAPMGFGADFEDLSIFDWWNYGSTPNRHMIKEGYGTLVSTLANDVPVKLNSPVTLIDWSGDGVSLTTPDGTIRAKACIITVSPGVLSAGNIRFTPELPEWKQDAISNLPMGLLTKVSLQFDGEKFGLPSNSYLVYDIPNEVPAEAIYFITWPFDFNHMFGFVGGKFGWELSAAGTDAAVDFALGEVVKMVGSKARKHFVKGHLTDWAENPMTLGAYAAVRPGQYSARADYSKAVGDRIFFAGEATAGGYIMLCSGAYMSGERAAGEVVATL